MAKAQYTQTVCIKVTPDIKTAIDKKLPNPSEWVRTAIQKQLKNEKTIK